MTIKFRDEMILPEKLISETTSENDMNKIGHDALDLVILRNDGQQDKDVKFTWSLISFEETQLKI